MSTIVTCVTFEYEKISTTTFYRNVTSPPADIPELLPWSVYIYLLLCAFLILKLALYQHMYSYYVWELFVCVTEFFGLTCLVIPLLSLAAVAIQLLHYERSNSLACTCVYSAPPSFWRRTICVYSAPPSFWRWISGCSRYNTTWRRAPASRSINTVYSVPRQHPRAYAFESLATRDYMPMEVPKVNRQKDVKASLPQGGEYNFVIRVFQASP